MHNKISEGKKDEKEEKEDDKNPDLSSSVKKAAKETGEFAKEMIPFYGTYKSYERTKEALGKGDYGQATLHGALTGLSAAGDVAIASGVGSLVGAGIKGLVGAGARKIAAAAATGKTAAKPATGSTPKLEVPQLKPGEGSAKFPDIPTTKVDTKLEKVPVAANVNKGTKVVQPSAPPNRIEKPTQQMRTTQQEKPVEAKPEPQKAPEKKIDITKPQVKTTIDTGTQKLPGAEVKLPGGKKFAEPTPKTPANVNVPAAKPATTPALTPGAKPAPSVSPAPSAAPSTTPKISPTAKEAPKPSQAKAPVKEPVPSRSPKKGGKTEKSRRLRLPFALPSFGDATPYSGSPHSHTNPIYKHRAKKFSEETRKEIETTARPSNDKYRKNVGRFGKSELTRQSTIQKQIIDEQTKRRAKIVKDVILKNPIPQPEGMGQNSQVDVKPKLNHKFDNSPE